MVRPALALPRPWLAAFICAATLSDQKTAITLIRATARRLFVWSRCLFDSCAACKLCQIWLIDPGVGQKLSARSLTIPLRKFCEKILGPAEQITRRPLVLEIDQAYRDVIGL